MCNLGLLFTIYHKRSKICRSLKGALMQEWMKDVIQGRVWAETGASGRVQSGFNMTELSHTGRRKGKREG